MKRAQPFADPAHSGRCSGRAKRRVREPRDRWFATSFLFLAIERGARTHALDALAREIAEGAVVVSVRSGGVQRRIRTSPRMVELALLCRHEEMKRREAALGREMRPNEWLRFCDEFQIYQLAKIPTRRQLRTLIRQWLTPTKKGKHTGS